MITETIELEPKEKAKQLIQKFELIDREQRYQDELNLFEAKQCALLCVDEIELYRKQIEDEYDEDLYHAYGVEEYWQEVRQEISLL